MEVVKLERQERIIPQNPVARKAAIQESEVRIHEDNGKLFTSFWGEVNGQMEYSSSLEDPSPVSSKGILKSYYEGEGYNVVFT